MIKTIEDCARITKALGLALACSITPALALSGSAAIGAPSQQDNPEPGRQGEILPGESRVLPTPYSKGVRVVGHEPIEGRTGNIQLAWSGHCAYVTSSLPGLIGGTTAEDPKSGVAVIDVKNPRAPRLARLLRDKGSIQTVETIHAVSTAGRKVMVAGAYGGGNAQFGPNDQPWLSIYDVTDCANPRLMAEYIWPKNAHTVTISPDGRYVFGTAQGQNPPFTGNGGLLVLDIADMAKPRFLGELGVTGPDDKSWEFASHEISFSADGRRIFAAVTDSTGDDLNPGLKPGFSPERVAPENGGVYILDNSDIMDGKPDPKLRLVGTVRHAGWHSVMPARINGVPFLVGGGELAACPGAYPQLINIADEKRPFIAGAFRLEMNYPRNCDKAPTGMAAFGAPAATLHYNDVDSAQDTRLGLFNFTAAGLRIADLRDPTKPVELAYFRPGDFCTGHVRYLPSTGHIWSICSESGFWVIELSPAVRAALRQRAGRNTE